MNRFEFATDDRIIFGLDASKELGALAHSLGTNALVVLGSSAERSRKLLDTLLDGGIEYDHYSVEGEPSIQSAQDGVSLATSSGCDLVVAIGGGSVIDCGKAIAALVANGGEPLDYLEVIGEGRQLTKQSLPMIAVPTTAGAGAEVTRNAVLKSAEYGVKVSMRSPYMLPTMALVDPLLTVSMPPEVTASTGLDALTQCLEPYVSSLSDPLTDAISQEGLRRAARSLRKAYEDGEDVYARTDMSIASLFGGLALANAKLGAVHGFAGVLGGMYPAPHGIICARLLPFVVESNVHALQSRQPDSPLLGRFEDIAQLVTGNQSASIADGVQWIQELCDALSVPGLSDFGIVAEDFYEIVTKSQSSSSMKGNPLTLTDEELKKILSQAL